MILEDMPSDAPCPLTVANLIKGNQPFTGLSAVSMVLRSDCAHAQTDQELRCQHIPEFHFSHDIIQNKTHLGTAQSQISLCILI